MRLSLLQRVLALHGAATPVALATLLADGRQALVLADAVEGELALDRDALDGVRALLAGDRCGVVDTGDGALFVEAWGPPPRLILVGAVHVAQALLPMAEAAGFRTALVDPRPAFIAADRFPGATALHGDWPEPALRRLRPDRRTAVVTLTHDPKIDDPALLAALRSEAFYVGALGSRRTHDGRRERLAAAGLDGATLDRIRAPVGLPLGAATPAEIAVSIVAEIIAVLRGGRAAAR